jgi:ribosomal protein S3
MEEGRFRSAIKELKELGVSYIIIAEQKGYNSVVYAIQYGGVIGKGRTKEEAIMDLLNKLKQRKEAD